MELLQKQSWHGKIFRQYHHFWDNLRKFSYYHRTVFEVVFIFLYSFEQVLLVLFTFILNDLNRLKLIISLFAIAVLTTFALHKMVIELRIKLLEDDLHELHR